MTVAFGEKLADLFGEGRRLCVGIDPHPETLAIWHLPDTAEAAERLGRTVIDAAQGTVACVKPQIALFERFGSAGFLALERVFQHARDAEVLLIADVKRGDIGSTFDAYASAWLAPGSPLEADAMTAHAYHGFSSLRGAHPYVTEHGKGLFVLSATSNPEAQTVQRAKPLSDASVASHLVNETNSFNGAHSASAPRVGSMGVVIGATVDLSEYGISKIEVPGGPILPILAPGFGFQGATVRDASQIFGALASGVIVSESRSIVNGGPAELTERIAVSNDAIREVFG